MLSAVFCEETPKTLVEKQTFLRRNQIVLYDVIESRFLVDSSGSSIADVIPASLEPILQNSLVSTHIYKRRTADALSRRHQLPLLQIAARRLPSTSPVRAAWSLPYLIDAWREAFAESFPNIPRSPIGR